MIVYKLFKQRKDGTLGPLFINARLRVPLGEWLPAEDHPTKGFARRPAWHSGLLPEAPHLSTKGRVWAECEVPDDDWEIFKRPSNQGGAWVLSGAIKVNRVLTPEEVESILRASQVER